MVEHVSVSALGVNAPDYGGDSHIMLALYGPRGGTKTIEMLDVSNAVDLLVQLETKVRLIAKRTGFTEGAYARLAAHRREMRNNPTS